MIDLVKSQIFYHKLDYDEWPQEHHKTDRLIIPFNGELGTMRNSYMEIVGKALKEAATPSDADNAEEQKEE